MFKRNSSGNAGIDDHTMQTEGGEEIYIGLWASHLAVATDYKLLLERYQALI